MKTTHTKTGSTLKAESPEDFTLLRFIHLHLRDDGLHSHLELPQETPSNGFGAELLVKCRGVAK